MNGIETPPGFGVNTLFPQNKTYNSTQENKLSLDEFKAIVKNAFEQNPLNNPFVQPKANPYGDVAVIDVNSWLKEFPKKVTDKFRASKIDDLVSRAYPNAKLQTLVIAITVVTFLFFNDDNAEAMDIQELTAFNERYLTVINDKSEINESDHPLTKAFYKMISRIRAVADDMWIKDETENLEKHFKSTLWEAENRKINRIPDLETYIKMRVETGAGESVLHLIELCEGINIPKHIKNELLNKIIQVFHNSLNWENDLRSCEREYKEGSLHNLIFVIQNQFKCSMEDAIEHSIRMLKNEFKTFEVEKQKIEIEISSTSASADLKKHAESIRKYVAGMEKCLGAHSKFLQDSMRYRQ